MKLVLFKKDSSNGCVRVGWPADDEDISWISLFYSPTDEEVKTGWVENLADPIPDLIFQEFARLVIGPTDRGYTVVEIDPGSRSEYNVRIQELRESGLALVTRDELNKRKGTLRRLFPVYPARRDVYFSGLTTSQMEALYRDYAHQFLVFLISKHPMDDWISELVTAQSMRLDKQFPQRVGRILVNHWRHGIELITTCASVHPFEDMARTLSTRFRVPLEIQEKRLPSTDRPGDA